jgi:hypothetical protein
MKLDPVKNVVAAVVAAEAVVVTAEVVVAAAAVMVVVVAVVVAAAASAAAVAEEAVAAVVETVAVAIDIDPHRQYFIKDKTLTFIGEGFLYWLLMCGWKRSRITTSVCSSMPVWSGRFVNRLD